MERDDDTTRRGEDAPPAQNTSAKGHDAEPPRTLEPAPPDDTARPLGVAGGEGSLLDDPTMRGGESAEHDREKPDEAGSGQPARTGLGTADIRTTVNDGTHDDRIPGDDNLAAGDTATIDRTLAARPDGSGPHVAASTNAGPAPASEAGVVEQGDATNAEVAKRTAEAAEKRGNGQGDGAGDAGPVSTLGATRVQSSGETDDRSLEEKTIDGAIHLIEACIASGDTGTDVKVPAVEAASYHLASSKVPNYALGALQRVYGLGAGHNAGHAFVDGAWATNHLSTTELAAFKVALSELESMKNALS